MVAIYICCNLNLPSFLFFCVNRIVHSPESYTEDENKELQNMQRQSKETTSVTTRGKEVDL